MNLEIDVMITYEQVIELIYSAIDELNASSDNEAVVKQEDTALYGESSSLDSVDLVNVLLSVEEALEDEFEVELVIANEKALSQKNSPFRTVSTLASYVADEVNSQ